MGTMGSSAHPYLICFPQATSYSLGLELSHWQIDTKVSFQTRDFTVLFGECVAFHHLLLWQSTGFVPQIFGVD